MLGLKYFFLHYSLSKMTDSASQDTVPLLGSAADQQTSAQYGSTAKTLREPSADADPLPATSSKRGAYPLPFVLFTFCACNFCVSLCYALIMPFFPQEAVKKGGNATLSGIVLASYEFSMLFMAPFISRVMLRWGAKPTLLAGVFVAGICTILFGLLDRVPAEPLFFILAIITRLLEGLGSVAYYITSMTLRTAIFSSYLALAFALIEAMFALGMAIGPAIGGAMYSWGGYSLPFFVLGVILLLLNLLQGFVIPGEKMRSKTAAAALDSDVDSSSSMESAAAAKKPTMSKFFLQPSISFSFCILVTGAFAVTFLNSILSFHLLPIVGSAAHVGYISFTIGLGECLVGPLCGYFQDRGGSSRLVLCLAFFTEFVGFLLVGPTPLLPFLSTSIPLIVIGCMLIGAGNGCLFTAPYKLALEAAVASGYPNSEQTYAILSACSTWSFSFGATLGPIVGGALQDFIGFKWAVTYVTIMPLIMLIISLVRTIWHVRERRKLRRTKNVE